MRKWLFAAVFGSVMVCVGQQQAEQPTQPRQNEPKLALSKDEQLQLENLKLRRENVGLQLQLGNEQIKSVQASLQSTSTELAKDADAFGAKALKDHGNPAFKWDTGTLSFIPVTATDTSEAKKSANAAHKTLEEEEKKSKEVKTK